MQIIRKPTFWLTIAAVIITVVLIILVADPGGDRHMQPADLILPLDNDAAIKQCSQEGKTYLVAQHDRLERIALYLEKTQDRFGTRPVALALSSVDLINKVSDESIRQDIQEILQQGTVKAITTGLDGEDRVQFILNYGDKEYRQGFYHIGSDPTDFFNNNENSGYEYNQVIRYEKLAANWYGFIYALADIKDADQYRQAAWNHLGSDGQKSITGDWSQARVSLIDWSMVGRKLDNKDRLFVVCVQFRHEQEGMLGPVTLYLDPKTQKVVGLVLLA
ncbi:MAG: hypothetical protein SCM11_06570 [Bacillota bacterium]|nr:hypothetical protein [Bacillota bacterium]